MQLWNLSLRLVFLLTYFKILIFDILSLFWVGVGRYFFVGGTVNVRGFFLAVHLAVHWKIEQKNSTHSKYLHNKYDGYSLRHDN